jgi:hypothetical protein
MSHDAMPPCSMLECIRTVRLSTMPAKSGCVSAVTTLSDRFGGIMTATCVSKVLARENNYERCRRSREDRLSHSCSQRPGTRTPLATVTVLVAPNSCPPHLFETYAFDRRLPSRTMHQVGTCLKRLRHTQRVATCHHPKIHTYWKMGLTQHRPGAEKEENKRHDKHAPRHCSLSG